MAINNRPTQGGGFGRVMRLSEAQALDAKRKISEQTSERDEKAFRLKEKYEKTPGLGLKKTKLDEMFEKNPRKAQNLMFFLEQTERDAYSNPQILENVKHYDALKESTLREASVDSGFLGVTPQDIVKVARIAYPNSCFADIFDAWGMTSMKDSIYKLETTYGSTARGATADTVTYENYGEGRYASEVEKTSITATATTTFTGTLAEAPLRPFTVKIYLNDDQVAQDDGAGHLIGSLLNTSGVNTINYTGGQYAIAFTSALTAGDVIDIYYNYSSENVNLFGNVGSLLLNLVVYDYRAMPYPLAVEWTRFTEELMQSKLGMSAKEALIAGAADAFRKGLDEYCLMKGIKATGWSDAVAFNTDYSAGGDDSSKAHAQSITNAILGAELKTYAQLGRHADKYNLVCDYMSANYLTKHDKFNMFNAPSRIGIYKWGEIMGHDVYVAPPNIAQYDATAKTGNIYVFGKGNDAMNVDSVVSVGTWKAGVTTSPVELKNFNSQMGMAFYGDIRVNNKYFGTKVQLTNLDANS